MSLTVAEQAPAKINLALAVTGRRDDGYHLLDTIAVFADVGDTIEAEAADTLSLAIRGPCAAGLPSGDGNLVLKAANALRASVSGEGHPVLGAVLRLDKQLPVASGIGGGSADAAAVLRALNRLWGSGLAPERLAQIGLTLGADVPMCLESRPLRARGIGEDMALLSGFPALHLVLVNPGIAVSTAGVFSRLAGRVSRPLADPAAVDGLDAAVDYLGGNANDLEAPALQIAPAIGEALNALRTSTDCRLARMSGSSATCFGIYPDAATAARAAGAIAAARPGWWVAATRTGPGPRAQ